MDHRFSKREYATSCVFTLFFTMLIAASYVDISLCPALTASSPVNYLRIPSVFDPQFAFFPCHLLDLILWIYFTDCILLILFLWHKYSMYRRAKQHYFLLDYCYFHNAFVCVLVLLVVLRFEPLGDVLERQQMPDGAQGDTLAVKEKSWLHSIPVPTDIVPIAAAISPTRNKPKTTVDNTNAAASSSPPAQLTRALAIFFLLLGGTVGPIVGAILMWDNALLFHSYDRMVSCYLHLAPAVVQGLVLHAAFVSHRRVIFMETILRGLFFDQEFFWTSYASLVDWAQTGGTRSTMGPSTFLWSDVFKRSSDQSQLFIAKTAIESHASFGSLFATLFFGHFVMFVVWQLCYHTFVESRTWLFRRRAITEAKKTAVTPTTVTTEEKEVGKAPCFVFVDDHVTAYTWLMEKPPLGKQGPFYRFVMLFGKGAFATKFMFAVLQCMLHAMFLLLGTVPLYCCLFGTKTVMQWWLWDRVGWRSLADEEGRKWVEMSSSAQPVLFYTLAFTALCIYNAAKMNKKWIKKLQSGYVEQPAKSKKVQ